MTQTIEQLTARVRELEADRDQWMSDCKTFHREMEKREQQILSLQAYAEQLRVALQIGWAIMISIVVAQAVQLLIK